MKLFLFLVVGAIALTLIGIAAQQGTKQDEVMVQGRDAQGHEFLDQGSENKRARKEFEQIDAELTNVYLHRLLDLEKSQPIRDALVASQKAWLAFREADGDLESAEDEYGSARPEYVYGRMIFLTRQRIYQLKTPFAQGWEETSTQISK